MAMPMDSDVALVDVKDDLLKLPPLPDELPIAAFSIIVRLSRADELLLQREAALHAAYNILGYVVWLTAGDKTPSGPFAAFATRELSDKDALKACELLVHHGSEGVALAAPGAIPWLAIGKFIMELIARLKT